MRPSITAIIAIALALPARADNGPDFTSCANIKEGVRRLDCYDSQAKKVAKKEYRKGSVEGDKSAEALRAVKEQDKAQASGQTDLELAKKAVLSNLKDPDSAKFGKFSLAGTKGACLTVNAKNSMGGYTGDQQAYLLREGEKDWLVVTIDKTLNHEKCIEVLSKP